MNSGNLNFLEPSGPLQASNGPALHFMFFYSSISRLRSDNNVSRMSEIVTVASFIGLKKSEFVQDLR